MSLFENIAELFESEEKKLSELIVAEEAKLLQVELIASSDYAFYIDSSEEVALDELSELLCKLDGISQRSDIPDAVVKLEYLTADGRWRSPKTDYYIDEENTLVTVSDSDPYHSPENWAEELIKDLGKQHPHRVIDVLLKHVNKHGILLEEGKEYSLMVDENDLFVIYEELYTLEWREYRTGQVEIILVKNIDPDESEITIIEKDVSRWQGSADYTIEETMDVAALKFFTDDIYIRENSKTFPHYRLCLYCRADNTTANFLLETGQESEYYTDLIEQIEKADKNKGDALRKKDSRQKKES